MAECMAVETAFLPAKGRILTDQFIINGLGRNMLAGFLSGKEPVRPGGRWVCPVDIFLQDRDNTVSQNSIAVRTVLASGNIDMFFCKINIPAMKAAEFADPDTRRIKESDLSFMFDICEGVN